MSQNYGTVSSCAEDTGISFYSGCTGDRSPPRASHSPGLRKDPGFAECIWSVITGYTASNYCRVSTSGVVVASLCNIEPGQYQGCDTCRLFFLSSPTLRTSNNDQNPARDTPRAWFALCDQREVSCSSRKGESRNRIVGGSSTK